MDQNERTYRENMDIDIEIANVYLHMYINMYKYETEYR